MRTTIDKVGRVVIPKAPRGRLRRQPDDVERTAESAWLQIEAVSDRDPAEQGDRPVIPAGGAVVDDEVVRALRDADQR